MTIAVSLPAEKLTAADEDDELLEDEEDEDELLLEDAPPEPPPDDPPPPPPHAWMTMAMTDSKRPAQMRRDTLDRMFPPISRSPPAG